MHVDRVAVIRVALRAAPDVGPLGDRADEQSGPIERPQSVHRRWSSAEHPQERLAARLIPRERFRGDGLHRVQLGRGWLPTSLGQRGDQRERLARIGQVDGDRRTVRPDPADDDIVGERIHVARVLEDGAHQAVGRQQPRLVLEPHHARDVILLIPDQSIGLAAALQVERAPHAGQELFGRVQLRSFRAPEQPVVLERPPSDRLEPAERVDVAQPSATILQLRFQEVRGRAEALAPFPGVVRQALGEPIRIGAQADDDGIHGGAHEPRVSGQQAGIEHGGRGVQALGRQRDGLVRRPHGVADGEAGVPERVEQSLRQRGDGRRLGAVVQQQEIDVGARDQGAAPVSAERDQRRARRPLDRRGLGSVQPDERGVDQLGASPRRPQTVVSRGVRALERGELVLQPRDGNRSAGRRAPDAHVRARPDRARRCGSGSPARPR